MMSFRDILVEFVPIAGFLAFALVLVTVPIYFVLRAEGQMKSDMIYEITGERYTWQQAQAITIVVDHPETVTIEGK